MLRFGVPFRQALKSVSSIRPAPSVPIGTPVSLTVGKYADLIAVDGDGRLMVKGTDKAAQLIPAAPRPRFFRLLFHPVFTGSPFFGLSYGFRFGIGGTVSGKGITFGKSGCTLYMPIKREGDPASAGSLFS